MPTPFLSVLAAGAMLILLANGVAAADGNAAALSAVKAFATAASSEYGNRTSISVGPLAPDTRLPECQQLDVFLPADGKLWGKTRVGVKCSAPTSWTAYLPVHVTVSGRYVTSSRKLNRGQTLTASDIVLREGILSELPSSVMTDPAQVIGQRTKMGLAAHQALRREHLVLIPVIRQGDRVKITARGEGFSVASEGVALNHAAIGEELKVRSAAGRTLNGVARGTGQVELSR